MAEIKERPILFSGPMVRAILDGQKTQTRRVVKFPPGASDCDHRMWPENPPSRWVQDDDGFHCAVCGAGIRLARTKSGVQGLQCPYGDAGDRLWVREAFTRVPASAYRMSEGVEQTVNPADPYEAAIYAAGWDRSIPKWKPSIHMPRWASRITLEITDVRVERLNDCSEADALAEGSQHPSLVPIVGAGWSSRDMYARLWEHINGEGSWVANPWVWVVTFKRIDAQAMRGAA